MKRFFLRIANVADTHIKHGRAFFVIEENQGSNSLIALSQKGLMEDNGQATDEID
jgi:hypothetical protein